MGRKNEFFVNQTNYDLQNEAEKTFLQNQFCGKKINDSNILNKEYKYWTIVVNNPRVNLTNYDFDWTDNLETDKQNLTDYLTEKLDTADYIAASLERGLEESHTEHLHIFVCFPRKRKGNSIFNALGKKCHLEDVKTSFEGMRDYVFKEGKWETDKKHEEKIENWQIEIGEKPEERKPGRRVDIEQAKELIEKGLTPGEIIDYDVRYIHMEKAIQTLYYRHRLKSTPLKRDVEVIIHTGVSGSGKTNFVTELDRKKTYIASDYSNGGSALLDGYAGEEILFLDEFRGQIPYNMLLTMLDNYTHDVHARYFNKYMLWKTVHITSVIPCEEWYKPENIRDTIDQLKRRINTIIFHYMTYENVYITDKTKFLENHEEKDITYHSYEFPSPITYDELEVEALNAAGAIPWFYPWSKYSSLEDNFENYLKEFQSKKYCELITSEILSDNKKFEDWKKSQEGMLFFGKYNELQESIPFYEYEDLPFKNKQKIGCYKKLTPGNGDKNINKIGLNTSDGANDLSNSPDGFKPFGDNDDNPFGDYPLNEDNSEPMTVLDFLELDI